MPWMDAPILTCRGCEGRAPALCLDGRWFQPAGWIRSRRAITGMISGARFCSEECRSVFEVERALARRTDDEKREQYRKLYGGR